MHDRLIKIGRHGRCHCTTIWINKKQRNAATANYKEPALMHSSNNTSLRDSREFAAEDERS